MTIEDLLAQLEHTSKGSRELDEAIYRWWRDNIPAPAKLSPDGLITQSVWTSDMEYAPCYTTSVDAAMSLIPDSWFVCIFNEDYTHKWFCALHTNRHAKQVHSQFPFSDFTLTGPLAMCVAALRAHQTKLI